MRILVTGASGFIGRNVWPHLVAAGHEVIAAGRRVPSEEHPLLHFVPLDLLQAGEIDPVVRRTRPDMLLHLAWAVEHGRFWEDPANMEWVAASLQLARAAERAGAQRIVMAGTCFEYAWPGSGVCHEETTQIASHTFYDISKNSLRTLVEEWAKKVDVSFSWARIFHLYGAGEAPQRLVADIARALADGRAAKCSSGRAVRDFMDVRDVGAALATLLLSDVAGIVNVASGQGVTIAEIARLMGELAERPDLIELGALPDRPNEPLQIVADAERLIREVGFVPRVSLRKGLRDALAYWGSSAGGFTS
jgi:nucleoside-diphosphate-sugar epimerase